MFSSWSIVSRSSPIESPVSTVPMSARGRTGYAQRRHDSSGLLVPSVSGSHPRRDEIRKASKPPERGTLCAAHRRKNAAASS
jgi:hypothetical protein